jgi:hypothetical protein
MSHQRSSQDVSLYLYDGIDRLIEVLPPIENLNRYHIILDVASLPVSA